MTGAFPAAWAANTSFPQLQLLALTGNQLSGSLPADVYFPALQVPVSVAFPLPASATCGTETLLDGPKKAPCQTSVPATKLYTCTAHSCIFSPLHGHAGPSDGSWSAAA